MAKVTFLVLEGCSYCNALKNKLGYINTSFTFYNCDGNNDLCDKAEIITGCDVYPMAIVLDINNSISQIVYISNDYNTIGKRIPLVDEITGFPVYSIDQMVEYIIKL